MKPNIHSFPVSDTLAGRYADEAWALPAPGFEHDGPRGLLEFEIASAA